MKFDNYEVKFVKGLYNGKRFESLEGYLYSDPQALISSKKDDKLKASDDLDYFFALPEKIEMGLLNGRLISIRRRAFKSNLDDVPEDVKNDLISRRIIFWIYLIKHQKKRLGRHPQIKKLARL